MRIFEIVLLVTVTILPFVKRPLARHVKPNYLLSFLGVIFLAHLLVEGWRWQMIPAYFLIGIIAWRLYKLKNFNPVRLSILRLAGFLSLLILSTLGWILPLALPVFTLPAPTGKYVVGTTMKHVKTAQDEIITEDPSDKRELMVKIWYPSEASAARAKSDPYIDQVSRSGFATAYGAPANALHYLDYVKTHAYQDLPIAKGSFPVLIFSHGFATMANGYYALLTEIASHGYVIVNMNHTYESLGTSFPDGRATYFDRDFNGKISRESMKVVEPVIEAFKDGLSYEERHPIVRKAAKKFFRGEIESRWASDVISVIDLLTDWNSEGLLKDKLALDKIGVFGHSVGGGTAGEVAIKDQRVKAAANLDGIQWGNMIDTLYHIPYLYVSADWPPEHEDINSHVYINKSTDYFYETKILTTGHPNFMDIPFMVPVQYLTGNGDIDPNKGIEIATGLVTSFFDKHLKELSDANPQKLTEQFDLLEMKVYAGDSIR